MSLGVAWVLFGTAMTIAGIMNHAMLFVILGLIIAVLATTITLFARLFSRRRN